MRRAPNVGVGAVGLLLAGAVRQVARGEELAHLGAATQLGDEIVIEPRLVDAQLRVHQQAVAIEALDVVALVRAAVAPDVDAVLVHRGDEQRAGDCTAQRGGVEVGLPGSGDVERAALQRHETLVHQFGTAVDEAGSLRAVFLRAVGHARQVGFVHLTEIGGVAVGVGPLLAHPGNGSGCVESAAERNTDAFANGEGSEHLGHQSPRLPTQVAAPLSARNRPASEAREMASPAPARANSMAA
ncbi:unannotated protein [freshwater metagenome]|uniref:Unannotated protein n=1 Tax=freshwater metagenome TaxID=449393 RepID=A0A6J7Q6X1_9ZZZZ